MSLETDGVWAGGLWASTVWADGVWRVGAYVADVPTVPGLEYTMPANRMHYRFSDDRMHYTMPNNRMHYSFKGDD